MSGTGANDDLYGNTEYRRLIAWERRIDREAPFLQALLADAPDRSVLDVGCGTGEHVATFAAQDVRAVGLDPSPAMIRQAREHEARGHGRFVEGEAKDAATVLEGEAPFGLALCLGNVLPHVDLEADLLAFLRGVHDVLRPRGLLVIQIVNYARIREQGLRHLPVNVRPLDDGREVVFLRLLVPRDDGRMLFVPTTLELDPEADVPVVLKTTKRVPLRAWEAGDLERACRTAGFSPQCYGDMQGGAFDALESPDLVVVARR